MKNVISLSILLCCNIILFAQKDIEGTVLADSLITKQLNDSIMYERYVEQLQKEVLEDQNRFKIYSTPNIYSFLKLDTQTGIITRVQWGNSRDHRLQVYVNRDPLNYEIEGKVNGRFDIQLTTNIYNFLLIDKIDGRVWQCQWSNKESENMVIRIPLY